MQASWERGSSDPRVPEPGTVEAPEGPWNSGPHPKPRVPRPQEAGAGTDRMGLHSSLEEGGALSPRARPQQQARPSPTPCVEQQRQGAAGCRARGAEHGGSEGGEARATGQQEASPQIGAPGHQGGPTGHGHPSTPPRGRQTGRWARADRPLTRAPQPRTPAARGPAEPWGPSQPAGCCGSILTAPRQGLAAPSQAPAACSAVAHLPSTRRPPRSKGGQQT